MQQWVADILENYKIHYDVHELIMNLGTPMQSTYNYHLLPDKPELERFFTQYKHHFSFQQQLRDITNAKATSI
jgi:hypothetical protein